MEKTIAKIEKSATEEIIIQATEFKGYDLIDIRAWALREGKESVPTRKGITFNPALLPELIKALQAAQKAIAE